MNGFDAQILASVSAIISKPSRNYLHFVDRNGFRRSLIAARQDVEADAANSAQLDLSLDMIDRTILRVLRDPIFCVSWGTWVYSIFDSEYAVFSRIHYKELDLKNQNVATMHHFKVEAVDDSGVNETPESMGKKIRQLRNGKAWAQRDLASYMSSMTHRQISANDISMVERGLACKNVSAGEILVALDDCSMTVTPPPPAPREAPMSMKDRVAKGAELRKARKKYGWPQHVLATQLSNVLGRKVSAVEVSSVELGKNVKNLSVVEALKAFEEVVKQIKTTANTWKGNNEAV